MKVIDDDDDEIFPPRNIEVTNIFRTATWKALLVCRNNNTPGSCSTALDSDFGLHT